MSTQTFTAFLPFCGLGAGARGFIEAVAQLGKDQARFVNLGGIDCDREACADVTTLTGAPALEADVHDLTPAELLAWLERKHGPEVARRRPDAVFASPPCKGLSRLMGREKAATPKYQRLNSLVYEGLFLMLETWAERPPLLVVENVPGIVQRGAELLDRVERMLTGYGYVMHRATHDCGEIGGLAQHRKRFLLVARDPRQVCGYVYQPPKQRVKGCGEVLAELPFPGDAEAGGPLHRLPAIDWITWLRLALIPPGGDWRDLPTMAQLLGKLGMVGGDGARVQLGQGDGAHENKFSVGPWEEPARTVIGATRPGSGAACVADPLDINRREGRYSDQYRIGEWEEPAKTVTGCTDVQEGAALVAEPVQLGHEPRRGTYGVMDAGQPSPAVRGRADVRTGTAAVADPISLGATAENAASFAGRPGLLGVLAHDQPSKAVTAGMAVTSSNTPAAVAEPFKHVMKVLRPEDPSGAITSATGPTNGSPSVAEPLQLNIADPTRGGALGVQRWTEPARMITGDVRAASSNSPGSVADPRPFDSGRMGVTSWNEPSRTVTGESYPSNGGASVADPRLTSPLKDGQSRRERIAKYQILDWRKASGVVAGPGSNGVYGVADVRLGCEPRSGTYGVLSWQQAARTIIGEARVDSGPFAVADPRPGEFGWRPPEGVVSHHHQRMGVLAPAAHDAGTGAPAGPARHPGRPPAGVGRAGGEPLAGAHRQRGPGPGGDGDRHLPPEGAPRLRGGPLERPLQPGRVPGVGARRRAAGGRLPGDGPSGRGGRALT